MSLMHQSQRTSGHLPRAIRDGGGAAFGDVPNLPDTTEAGDVDVDWFLEEDMYTVTQSTGNIPTTSSVNVTIPTGNDVGMIVHLTVARLVGNDGDTGGRVELYSDSARVNLITSIIGGSAGIPRQVLAVPTDDATGPEPAEATATHVATVPFWNDDQTNNMYLRVYNDDAVTAATFELRLALIDAPVDRT